MIKLGTGAPSIHASAAPESEHLEGLLVIECAPAVVDQIRDHIYSGFQRVSRGGIEVAGVLFGLRDGDTLSLHATHPIFCEYKTGPTVVLSERDRAALQDFLASSLSDPRFTGLEPVGWYVSHRTGTELLDRDSLTFDEFFPSPSQITLVVRGERKGALPVAIFARDAEGFADRDKPLLEWEIEPLALPGIPRAVPRTVEQPSLDSAAQRPRRWSNDASSSGSGAAAAPAQAPVPRNSMQSSPDDTWFGPSAAPAAFQAPAGGALVRSYVPGPAYSQPNALMRPLPASRNPLLDTPAVTPERRARWEWLAAWAACILLAGILGYGYYLYRSPAALNMRLTEREGQMETTWDHGFREMFFISGGSVEIREGGVKREFNLSKQQLESGSFLYVTDAQDVAVRLRVSGFGRSLTESARFLGNRPQATRIKGAADVREERDRLVRDNYYLRMNQAKSGESVKQLEERIQQLERLLKQGQGGAAEDPAARKK